MGVGVDEFTRAVAQHGWFAEHGKYLLLFVIGTFEGTGTMLAAGAMTAAGWFSAGPALAVCMIAETAGGFLWYGIGYFAGGATVNRLTRTSPAGQAFMERLRRHSEKSAAWVVLLVKLTYSVAVPTLIFVGSLKYDIKKFAAANVVGSIGWVLMLFGLGYAFGKPAVKYLPVFRQFGTVALVVIVVIITLWIIKSIGTVVMRRVGGSHETP